MRFGERFSSICRPGTFRKTKSLNFDNFRAMSATKVVTRFAPSPTGFLHVGGARTAVFSYLFSKHHGGDFILRIEDTDTARSTKEFEAEILDSMKWLGMDWVGEPVYQTQRFDLYREYIQKLVDEGKAYKCWSTPEEVDQMREKAKAEGRKPMYDRRYRDFEGPEPEGPYVVRFKTPLEGETVLNDLVKGEIRFDNTEIDDFIILRSDNSPTYNLTVVVDDCLMGVTHVIRGDDHVNNTPKQIMMMRALGFDLPQFAHAPIILGPDKAKLSKRHGAVAVSSYRDEGFLPEAMMNALARLGWSHGDQEVFSTQELVELFDLSKVGKSPAVFDVTKMEHLNNEHLKKCSDEEIVKLLSQTYDCDVQSMLETEGSRNLFRALVERTTRLTEFKRLSSWYFDSSFQRDSKEVEKNVSSCPDSALKSLAEKWNALDAFDGASAFACIKEVAKAEGVKLPVVAKAVRVLLTGTLASPDMGIVLEGLGRERAMARLVI